MYDDPSHIRKNIVKSRFNERQNDLIRAAAQYNQMQVATFVQQAALFVANAGFVQREEASHEQSAA